MVTKSEDCDKKSVLKISSGKPTGEALCSCTISVTASLNKVHAGIAMFDVNGRIPVSSDLHRSTQHAGAASNHRLALGRETVFRFQV
jgi:hypothetical protein